MSIEPKIDLLAFSRLSIKEFVKRYKRDVRTMIHWGMLKHQETGIKVLCEGDTVYLTRWDEGKGNFSFDSPQRLVLGSAPIFVRVPGFKAQDVFFLVDGTHRILELAPAMILVDYVVLESDEYGIVVDFLGQFFFHTLSIKAP